MEALTFDVLRNLSADLWDTPQTTDELRVELRAEAERANEAEAKAMQHLQDLEQLEEKVAKATRVVLQLGERLHAFHKGVPPPAVPKRCTLEEATSFCESALPPLAELLRRSEASPLSPHTRSPASLPLLGSEDEVFFDAEEEEKHDYDEDESLVFAGVALMSGQEMRRPPEDQESLWEAFMGDEEATVIPGKLERRPSSIGLSLNDYVQRHAADYAVLRALEPIEGWCYRLRRAGVDIYTKDVPNMACKCFRGVVQVKTYGHGARSLVEALKAHGRRQEYDELCLSSRVVEEYPPFYSVGHFKFSSGSPFVSDRDMLILSHLIFGENGAIYAVCRATEHDECPEDPSCARATFLAGGYCIHPSGEEDVFTVMFVGCVDGGGWVPGWVQDMVAWRQPLALGSFRDQFEAAAKEGGDRLREVRGEIRKKAAASTEQ